MKLLRLTAPKTAAVAAAFLGVIIAALVTGGIIAPSLATTADCSTGSAVSDQTNNPGLVSDCETLLKVRDTLAGSAALNWSSETPIQDWEGVTVAGTPLRVTGLSLGGKQLSGSIPSELGDLSNLEWLSLGGNELSGPIPSELGYLSNLIELDLRYNLLSGPIPPELVGLPNLERLYLMGNQFSGCIPVGLRSVDENDLAETGTPFCDLLLSRLTIAPGSLSPAFDPYVNYYIAMVGSASQFTVSPVNDYNASIRFLDENHVEMADANDTLAGYQANLGDGTTTVNLSVISPDGAGAHTYVIQASRKPATLNACATGGAVSNPVIDPGLVSDCVALLSGHDTLEGSSVSDWSSETPIRDWEGVRLGGYPQRVTEVTVP